VAQREKVFAAFGPSKDAQLYDRGIRRRFAPMVDNDRRRLELAYSMLFTLPGTPMLQYGDEIGIGDNLALPERECARTPMQWSADRNGGFSTARRTVRPVIADAIYGYKRVNVEAQRRDPHSLLNWVERKVRMRRECPEISWGDWKVLKTNADDVLVMEFTWRGHSLIVLHNFVDKPRAVHIPVATAGTPVLVDLLWTNDSRAEERGYHEIELEPYGYRWFRAKGLDRNVPRV
jgi:maltose alpha-D-glucosyltransferase / alpha-amylase